MAVEIPPPVGSPGFKDWLFRFWKQGGGSSGNWTPVLTFATPGDLSVTASAYGYYHTDGTWVDLEFTYTTSAFTFTTASGNLKITGIPFNASSDSGYLATGEVIWAGITKASYTQIGLRVSSGSSVIDTLASGSGQALSNVTAADMPSGGTVALRGHISYHR